ncbi:SMP-30/Gluconolactonase/LRE-like region [Fusarium oxysporum f. sp. vasinfectum]|nr:SMP-30/Gluconolactonase/LRE-like region [Fusarium oxysporum f. sp. vasinfectum]
MPSSISVLAGVLVPVLGAVAAKLPSTAQIIDQKSFNVLKDVPPPAVANDSLVFTWPGVTEESLLEKPFHVYDEEFYDVIGKDPSLTLIATSDTDPIFHEAVVWYPPTEEVFFVQNAGAPAAGTGLNKSSIIQKISLKEADAVRKGKQDEVKVTVVDSNPQVINPNGKLSGTYYKGNIIFAGEGQGDDVPSALYLMNPLPPYNTTTLLNNYFGRQFNSLNDVGINPRNGDLYFTDTLYGYLQDFRPVPGLRNQVYRYNFDTGAVTVVADDFTLPNGIGFGPDGKKVYVTDTGIALGFYGRNLSSPASVYSFDVNQDGTLQNRKTFAYVASFIPDGVHTDSKGRVYAGCGDGVHVWTPPASSSARSTPELLLLISSLLTIVHDLLLDHIPGDRDKILSRLRRIQRRHEIKSSQRPPFRPAFVPLYDDDQVDNMLGIPDFEQAKSDLPAFVSIPTIQLDKPRPRTFPEISHHVKFLLQYHYRFGMHNGTVGEHVLGVDSMDMIRFASFFLVLNRSTRKKKARGRLFGPLRTVLTFSPGRYNGEPLRSLWVLDEHMKHWVEVERTTSGQAEASEEVARALRSLWTIATRFSTNFHLSSDRQLYQFDRLSMWRRILNYIRNDCKATSAKTKLLYRPDETSKRDETLQDLEDKLAAAIASLKRRHGTVQSELQVSRDNENKDMLRSIQNFEGNLSLACLLRMCTISTPTRYSITSQDITDIFAQRIPRLEWLVRDSVSQPQVYQISAISDELRILKEILHSQMHVVSQAAQSLARAIASSRPLEAVAGKTPESADVQASLGTGNGALGHERKTQIFISLQRKSQIRHRQLAYDIERLQDATERLKSQVFLNAEYIGAEANSPTSGCFVHKDLKPKTKVSLSTSLLL